MMLGHSDIRITSQIYTHLLDGDLKVRDDFTFDKSDVADRDYKLRSKSVSELVESLIKASAKLNTTEDLAALIEGLSDDQSIQRSLEIADEMIRNSNQLPSSATLKHDEQNVPLMIREGEIGQLGIEQVSTSEVELDGQFQKDSEVKNCSLRREMNLFKHLPHVFGLL